jgi:hypothetical protein
MFVTSHVLVGAMIGRVMARHPVGAFAAGVVSHFAMDACPHYGDPDYNRESPEFVRVARCDGCAGLAAMALAAGLSPRRCRRAVIAGMVGGAIVDTDKPMEYFFDWNPWPLWWQRFHQRVQNEERHRLPAEVATAAALVAVVCLVLPGRPAKRAAGSR